MRELLGAIGPLYLHIRLVTDMKRPYIGRFVEKAKAHVTYTCPFAPARAACALSRQQTNALATRVPGWQFTDVHHLHECVQHLPSPSRSLVDDLVHICFRPRCNPPSDALIDALTKPVSGGRMYEAETLSTLEFALRAKGVKNRFA